MPRRIPDYADSYTGWNKIASFGSIISTLSVFILILNIYTIFTNKKELNNNYWGTGYYFNKSNDIINVYNLTNTLEWKLPSPPQFHLFVEGIPILPINKSK